MANFRIPFEPEKVYHIYSHSNGKENIFKTSDNYLYFLKQYTKYSSEIAETFAYCLMPNHFHFIVRIKPENKLKEVFNKKLQKTKEDTLYRFISHRLGSFLNSYSKAFNKQEGRMGSLFTPNLHRRHINDISYLRKAIIYVHCNPIHHGFTKDFLTWRYSSYLSIISAKPTLLLRNEVIDLFDDLENFRHCHNQWKENSFDDIEF